MGDLLEADLNITLPDGLLARPGVPTGLRYRKMQYKRMRDVCMAQVDYLGFSSLVRQAHGRGAAVIQTYYQVTDLLAHVGARTDGGTHPTVALFAFSDTIRIVARRQGDAGIEPVVRATAFLLAACHGSGMPARAAVSRGELWAACYEEGWGRDGDFVTGPVVSAAYSAESAQQWAGGALDPDCPALLEAPPIGRLLDEGWLVPWDVPWKESTKAKALALNWTKPLRVPRPEYLLEVLDCNLPLPQHQKAASAWSKRRYAWQFAEALGPLPKSTDYLAQVSTPTGYPHPLIYAGPAQRLPEDDFPPDEAYDSTSN